MNREGEHADLLFHEFNEEKRKHAMLRAAVEGVRDDMGNPPVKMYSEIYKEISRKFADRLTAALPAAPTDVPDLPPSKTVICYQNPTFDDSEDFMESIMDAVGTGPKVVSKSKYGNIWIESSPAPIVGIDPDAVRKVTEDMQDFFDLGTQPYYATIKEWHKALIAAAGEQVPSVPVSVVDAICDDHADAPSTLNFVCILRAALKQYRRAPSLAADKPDAPEPTVWIRYHPNHTYVMCDSKGEITQMFPLLEGGTSKHNWELLYANIAIVRIWNPPDAPERLGHNGYPGDKPTPDPPPCTTEERVAWEEMRIEIGLPVVDKFAKKMKLKLTAKHKEKGGWDNVSPEWLCIYLETEIAELKAAIIERDEGHIRDEAVDVANLAMMVWDTASRIRAHLADRAQGGDDNE